MTPDRARQLVAAFATKRILVIGDLMLDEFIWGRATRLSPEAPVPVVEASYADEEMFAGGAANVARNIRTLGAAVTVSGRVGEPRVERFGDRLVELLNQDGIDTSLITHQPGVPTTVKTRVLARDKNSRVGATVVSRPHHYVRIDREVRTPLSADVFAELHDKLDAAIAASDAVIVEDYAKGFITQQLVDRVAALCQRHGRPWSVDPNPANPLAWPGPSVIKPNRAEAFAAAEVALSDDPAALELVGRRLLDKWDTAMLLVTLGEDGMRLFERDGPGYASPTQARLVYDVSGAGDTAIATFTLALAAGANPGEATELANHASGVVVAKLGTATVTPTELLAALAPAA
jgi:D-beta-D-heptose 7-phosphate kinase/D-beta-D-heptose 1-phosphate adenosyltransferase